MKKKILLSIIFLISISLIYVAVRFYIQPFYDATVRYSKKIELLEDRVHYMHDNLIQNSALNHPNMMEDLTILVPSYDPYSELWNPFFTLLFRHWPDLTDKYSSTKIILTTNHLDYNNPRVQNIKIGKDKSWSDSLAIALSHVNTKYVLILLEDYIINQDINSNRINELIHFMDETNGAYMELARDDRMLLIGHEKLMIHAPNRKDIIYRSKGKKSRYITSLQAAMWKKKTLQELLVPGESAWEFEKMASYRSKTMPEPFYMVMHNHPIAYLNAAYRGKYQKYVVDYINYQYIDFKPKKLPLEDKVTRHLNPDH